MSARHGFHARSARDAADTGAHALAQARLFRSLLAETDAALRSAWHAGSLPDGVIPADLIERTRAALAGETTTRPMTTAEAVADAANKLSALGGHRL